MPSIRWDYRGRRTLALDVRHLNEHVGSEVVIGTDELLTEPAAQALRRLLVERGVIVIKRIGLNESEQRSLSEMMGALRQEGDRGVLKITLDRQTNARADYLKGSFLWHIDATYDDVPPFGSLLTGIALSEVGGATEFANSYAAYEALSQEVKERVANIKVVHSLEVSMRRAGIEPTAENLAYWLRFPDKVHNLVWTHASGRKSLVIGCHASHIEGMPREEGEALLQELLGWATQPAFVYRHQWEPGDLLMWDNTGVLHRVQPYPLDSGRLMRRTTLLGEEAFA